MASNNVALAEYQGESALSFPNQFRIGPFKHDYTYSHLEKGLFKCCRASDEGKNKSSRFCLYLYYSVESFWVAVDAPEDARSIEEVVEKGVPIFRSSENVLVADWHVWETNWNAHKCTEVDWRATGLNCCTTIL